MKIIMKKLILLNEDEKSRILNLHETAKNLYENKKPTSLIKEDNVKKEEMKKIIKLTESDLEKIVKRVIEEQYMGVAFGGEQNGLKIRKAEANEQAQAGGLPKGLVTDNPEAVTVTSSLNGKDTSVTFMKNGTFMSQIPLDSNNPKSNRGRWKYTPKTTSQFGGGYVEYTVTGADGSTYAPLKQELNGDIPGNEAIQTMIANNKPEYAKLPIMTKLLNMDNSVIDTRMSQAAGQVAASKIPGCPAGCIKDPNYRGTPQKWAPSK
jgi:hypothetical protein